MKKRLFIYFGCIMIVVAFIFGKSFKNLSIKPTNSKKVYQIYFKEEIIKNDNNINKEKLKESNKIPVLSSKIEKDNVQKVIPPKEEIKKEEQIDLKEEVKDEPKPPVVENIPVTGINVSQESIIVQYPAPFLVDKETGEVVSYKSIKASVYPSNATNQNVVWSSLTPDIVTVNQKGDLFSHTLGFGKISVKSEDGSFEKIISVKVVSNYSFSPRITSGYDIRFNLMPTLGIIFSAKAVSDNYYGSKEEFKVHCKYYKDDVLIHEEETINECYYFIPSPVSGKFQMETYAIDEYGFEKHGRFIKTFGKNS